MSITHVRINYYCNIDIIEKLNIPSDITSKFFNTGIIDFYLMLFESTQQICTSVISVISHLCMCVCVSVCASDRLMRHTSMSVCSSMHA